MAIIGNTASDSTYHLRHSRRTLGRAKCIAGHIHASGSLLDVGCNRGITSAYLLESGKATHVTGIELHAKTVEESLRCRPDFSFLEGNVVDLELPQRYDYVVYGAVHHHILNLFGLSAAIRTLKKLARHCTRSLFFETGQLGEGGRWSWQPSMRRHFRTDEEHFFYLLRSIEHLIDGFEIIGSFWIHGIRRRYLRIDMRKDATRSQDGWLPWPDETDGPFVRSRGSSDQMLCRSNDPASSDSPAHFWIADSGGKRLFVKKHAHLPIAAEAEWAIGSQLDEEWAVRPVARLKPDGANAYPYYADATPVTASAAATAAERRRLASSVVAIFREACRIEVSVPEHVLLGTTPKARLVDVIDLHGNNILVVRDGERSVLRVIDFEVQSRRYAPRNRIHLARILRVLRQHRLLSLTLFLQGYAGVAYNLMRYQLVPFAGRIVERQPSLASLLVSDARTLLGRLTGRLLRMVGIR